MWKYYSTKGSLSYEGNIKNNKADSVYTYYTTNGSLFGKINYINSKAEGESKWYYESGKLCELAVYKQGIVEKKINYDEKGEVLTTTEADCGVEFIEGENSLMSFIQSNIVYPAELLANRIEGVAIIHYIVRKDGKVDAIEIQQSNQPLFDQEALRVFKLIKQMKPARSHGQLIEKECTLPIVFKL